MSKTTNLDQKQRFIELRAKNHSFDDIAGVVGVSKPTLIKWSRELELELTNQKALELDAIKRQYSVTREHRIELLGGQLKTVRDELATRDLKEVSTTQLLRLCVLLNGELEKLETPTTFAEMKEFELESLMSPQRVEWSPV